MEETLDLYRLDGKPLPPAPAGRDLANSLHDRPDRFSAVSS